MNSEDRDEIHIKLVVATPIEDSVISDITERLQKVHSDTTLTSITQSEGALFFHCPSSNPEVRDRFVDLFIQWLDTRALSITNYNIILGRLWDSFFERWFCCYPLPRPLPFLPIPQTSLYHLSRSAIVICLIVTAPAGPAVALVILQERGNPQRGAHLSTPMVVPSSLSMAVGNGAWRDTLIGNAPGKRSYAWMGAQLHVSRHPEIGRDTSSVRSERCSWGPNAAMTVTLVYCDESTYTNYIISETWGILLPGNVDMTESLSITFCLFVERVGHLASSSCARQTRGDRPT